MAKVRAMYNYSYDYEGSMITFKIGEEFQLLSKTTTDWWHVRRWKEGAAQDIYVPANYVKEVESEPKEALYENMADLVKKIRKEKRPKSNVDEHQYDLPVVPTPRNNPLTRQSSSPIVKENDPKANGYFVVKEQKPEADGYSEPTSPTLAAKRTNSAKKESSPSVDPVMSQLSQKKSKEPWLTNKAVVKPRSKSVNTTAGEPPSTPKETTADRSTSPTGKQGIGKAGKIPPPVLPKTKPGRPKSMIVTSPTPENAVSVDTFFKNELASTFLKSLPSEASRSSPVQQQEAGAKQAEVKRLALRKSPSPQSILAEALQKKPPLLLPNGSLPRDATAIALSPSPTPTPTPTPTSAFALSPLPGGWTEHRASSGHTYYHNSITGQSSWTRPPADDLCSPGVTSSPKKIPTTDPMNKVAPRGWTREINPFTQTPIYTNCRNMERWAPASDSAGNLYYYNMANSSLTMGELPEISDVNSAPSTPAHRSVSMPTKQENIYDRLSPPAGVGEPEYPRPRTHSDPKAPEDCSSPKLDPLSSSQSSGAFSTQWELFASSVLNRHGYLQRKKLYDAAGKKGKGGWQKLYVMLQEFQLYFYPDHKAAKEKPVSTFSLLQATVCPYTKDKRKNVFQVSSPFGEQFLLQGETPQLMNDWYSTIQSAIEKGNMDYQQHPERYKRPGGEHPLEDSGESSPKQLTKNGHARRPSRDLLDEDEDPMDDLEISAADKSVRIRSRLKKLMARRPQLETLKKSGIIQDPVFGCELGKLCEREKSSVPKFFLVFMEHIERVGLDSVGLYRLSGNAASVQKLRCMVEQDQTFNLNDSQWVDINIITGCLKLYLRELPDPLVPFRCYRGFIDSARNATQSLRLAAVAARVKELPIPNYNTLKTLMLHLRKVVEYGHVNKMQATNLAIVFGPTVMRAENDSLEMATLMPVQNGIVEMMITEFESIFRK